ncbi:MAG: O-antigen/teichoic acid export membrane protein [Lentimonas sp.]|jgi:O-antigen/teichoic acid export membrane protein
MQRKFFSNLVLMMVLNLLVKPIAIFGIDSGVQNRVGSEEYGLYFSLLNLAFLFNILMDLGINNFTTKSIAQHPKSVSKYIGKMMSFRLLLFFAYALITCIAGLLIGHGEYAFNLLVLLILNQFFVVLIAYARSHFSGLLYFKLDALFSVLDRIFLILICGSVFVFSTGDSAFQIEWFVWIQSICYLLTLLAAFYLLRKKIGRIKLKWNFPFSFAIIKQSFPYALLILLMMFYTRQDSIMIERIHPNGAFEAGVYAQGFRLLDAFFMFGMLFTSLLLPLFAQQIKDKLANISLLRLSGKMLISIAILISFLCYHHAETILGWIYENDIEQSVQSFRWLILAFIGMSISLIFGTYLTAEGDMKFLNLIAFIGIIVNLALNLYLIPSRGAEGAAYATLATQSLTSLIQATWVVRKLGADRFYRFIVQLSLFALLLWGIKYLTLELSHNIWIDIIIGTALLMGLRIFNPKELVFLLKKEGKAADREE